MHTYTNIVAYKKQTQSLLLESHAGSAGRSARRHIPPAHEAIYVDLPVLRALRELPEPVFHLLEPDLQLRIEDPLLLQDLQDLDLCDALVAELRPDVLLVDLHSLQAIDCVADLLMLMLMLM